MGYSARYHVASLAAVFLALAIGILIGVGFGDDIVNDTRKDLERSLTGDLNDARDRADELAGELSRAEDFGEEIYPALVNERLSGKNVGVLAFGNLPGDVSRNIETALEPTGAELVAVAVVREPLQLGDLANELEDTRFGSIESDAELLEILARGIGRQVVGGGPLLERLSSHLLTRASGSFGSIDELIVVRDQPGDLEGDERSAVGRLESGVLEGATSAGAIAVGVERTDTEDSSIGFFTDQGIATVDHVDTVAGRVALVFALLGAEGNFGVSDSADRMLPDLLTPAEGGGADEGPRTAGGQG